MYRAYCYYNPTTPNDPETAISLRSGRYPTRAAADAALAVLLAVPGVTGGGLEAHVPGIGWVLADEESDVESAVYLHRLHESDRQTA